MKLRMTGLYKFQTEKNTQACVHDLLCLLFREYEEAFSII